MDKTIAVLGTGANGSCVAADLTNAGLDVVLIDQWPAHVEAMRADGLHITLRQGEIHAKVRAHRLCEEGRKRGIPTPANETLVEVTRRIYLGELEPDPSNLAIALELLNAKSS
jgi:ketopantoate reductase